MHQMGAVLLKNPSLIITEDESKRLAAAITRVSELYEIPLLDEKARAWINLGLVGVEVYGTRITAAIVERKKKAPAPSPASSPQIIRPFEHQRHSYPPQPPMQVQEVPNTEEMSDVGQA